MSYAAVMVYVEADERLSNGYAWPQASLNNSMQR